MARNWCSEITSGEVGTPRYTKLLSMEPPTPARSSLSFLNEDESRVLTRERGLSERLMAMEENNRQQYPTGLPKYLKVGTGTVDFEGKDDVKVLYFIMEKGKNDLRGARLTKQEYQECVKTLIEALIVLHKQHIIATSGQTAS